MKRQIYLIGFMGSGKSTTGRALAERLGRPRREMDELIESRAGKPIARIFAEDGEEALRGEESRLLRELASGEAAVISCGGGTAMRAENVAVMKESGVVVLLSVRPETVLSRVGNGHRRPLLEGRKSVGQIAELMEERRVRYEAAADLTVETDEKTPEEIAAEIRERLGDFIRE